MDTQQQKTPTPFSEEHHNHVGPILGVLIIVLILILGGLYLWGAMISDTQNQVQEDRVILNNEPETPRAEADKLIMDTVSPSDELGAIEADLESTNIDSLDTELDQVGTELNTIMR